MRAIPALQIAANHEMRLTGKTLLHTLPWLGLFLVAIPPIEGKLFPVLREIHISKAGIVEATGMRGRQLCFDYTAIKARDARGVRYIAEVYHDDYPNPAFRGVTHRDGTPYGGPYAGRPAGPILSNACVAISDLTEPFDRLGVRLHIEWKPMDRPWTLTQAPIWIDYYSKLK